MNIDNINYFNRACKEVNKYETKTLGLKIIKLFEEFGELSAEIIKERGETYKTFDKDNFFGELADVQILVSSIYETMKSRSTIVSDRSSMRIVKTNYEELKHQFGRISDPIWVYFQIANNIGKLAETITPRTSPKDDQFRIKHLMIAQAYILYYYDLLYIKYKKEFNFDLYFKQIFDKKIQKWAEKIKEYQNNSKAVENVNMESISNTILNDYTLSKDEPEERTTNHIDIDGMKIEEAVEEVKQNLAETTDRVKLDNVVKDTIPERKEVPDMFKNNDFLEKIMKARTDSFLNKNDGDEKNDV